MNVKHKKHKKMKSVSFPNSIIFKLKQGFQTFALVGIVEQNLGKIFCFLFIEFCCWISTSFDARNITTARRGKILYKYCSAVWKPGIQPNYIARFDFTYLIFISISFFCYVCF